MKATGISLAVIASALTLVDASCARETRQEAACTATAGCQAVHFAFTSFTGQKVTLQIDDELVLEDTLDTADWTTALSRHLELPVSRSSHMKLTIDGVVAYEGGIIGPQVRTVYIDPRQTPVVWQTDHPSPLLD